MHIVGGHTWPRMLYLTTHAQQFSNSISYVNPLTIFM